MSASLHYNFGGGRETDARGCSLPQKDEGGQTTIRWIPSAILYLGRFQWDCCTTTANVFLKGVYDGEGKLIDRSYCCSRFSIYYPGVCEFALAYNRHPDETFRGRNAETGSDCQKGDIVEVYRGDEVKLAIVVGTPLTTEWIWERNQAVKDKRGLDELPYDETDDSYTVIDGPGYEYHEARSVAVCLRPSLSCAALSSETIQGVFGKG